MLFVDEDFEKSHPIFSEPKKVHPKTEDEIARRLRSMFGEFVHENEEEPIEQLLDTKSSTQDSLKDLMSESHSSAKTGEAMENVFSEKQISEIVTRNCETFPTVEQNNIVQTDIPVPVSPTITSRRSSLKRQCKERISLLDYNPMFVIRAKRSKPTPLNKVKASENFKEQKQVGVEMCITSNISSIDILEIPPDKSENLDDTDEIPILKKCPDFDSDICYSKVPEQDSPPLLKIVAPAKNTHEQEDNQHQDKLLHLKSLHSHPKYRKDYRNFFKNSQDKIKSKKHLKRKKKVIYDRLPVLDFTIDKTNSFSDAADSYDSKTGFCEIKNGVIKIRFTKKNDTSEFSNTSCHEKEALKSCRELSVPLTPLSPSVYSAYCGTDKCQETTCSDSKTSTLTLTINSPKATNNKTLDLSNSESFSLSNSSHKKSDLQDSGSSTETESCDIDYFENCVKQSLIHEAENTHTSKKDINLEIPNDDSINIESCLKSDSVSKSKNTEFSSLHRPQFDTKTLKLEEGTEKNLIGDVRNNLNEYNSKFKHFENNMLTAADGHGNESSSSVSLLKNSSAIENVSTQFQAQDAKIMCSIDLTLIKRLPMKSAPASNESKTQLNSEKNTEGDVSIPSICDIPSSPVPDVKYIYELTKTMPAVKKESLTPTLIGMSIHCNRSESITRTDSDIQEAYKEGTLHSACSSSISDGIDELISERKIFPCEKLPPNDYVFGKDPNLSKVKIEVPDAILSNHERWNEYKEYKWCRNFSGVEFTTTLFKEQMPYNIANHRFWQDPELKKQYSSEYYLNEAKNLKHQADEEIDRMVQAMKYLEAVLYFILTGNAMEHSYIDTDRVHTMYKETLSLIRFISSKFQKLHNASCRNIDNKLTVLSLRCQSLLYLKMYQLRRDEIRSLHRNITTFLKSESVTFSEQVSPPQLLSDKLNLKPTQGSPSQESSPCSLTPSPAGSIASVSSQSSGYNSSEIGGSANVSNTHPQFDKYANAIPVSRHKYRLLRQQSAYLSNLHLCHDLWEHADYLSSKEHSREFFLELDEECGCLSLHSPFSALVHYVRKGLYKLKDGT